MTRDEIHSVYEAAFPTATSRVVAANYGQVYRFASEIVPGCIRSFLGGMRSNYSGLYVSIGGFTRDARYEADRANVPIRLLDLDAFVRLYVSNYEQTDMETRALLPLVRIYWPA